MGNIEKRRIMINPQLSSEVYFQALLQETYTCGPLSGAEIENIQLQCISLLSDKCERYHMGESSSIRVEIAESIMKSNLYTIGLYLKSLPDPEEAVFQLQTTNVSELYEQGRKLIEARFRAAKKLYGLVQKYQVETPNLSYLSTLSEGGIGLFFKTYDMDYGVHETPASIDYQLCNPVDHLVGIEYMESYLKHLYLENAFCGNFDPEKIHHLLYGYDRGYQHLLINIFEQVLTAALACSLTNRNPQELTITKEEIQDLTERLRGDDFQTLEYQIQKAAGKVMEILDLTNPSLQHYIKKSLGKITCNIENALRLNTLHQVFITPKDPSLEPKIYFESSAQMDNEAYRRLVDELLSCRFTSDKIKLIKEMVKSLDDLATLLLDVPLEGEVLNALFDTLEDVEIAAILKKYPLISELQGVDLSEEEQRVRHFLEKYLEQLPANQRELIFQMERHLQGD